MAREHVLVTTEWAEEHLGELGVVFIEVDEDTSAYAAGHLPGAVDLSWTADLQDQVRRDLLAPEQLEELFSRKGIANDDLIVLYGGNNNWFAAYAYWSLKVYGHREVRLMDGGRKRWEFDGRALTTEVVQRDATTYKAAPQDHSIRAFREEVIDGIGSVNHLDIRTPEEHAGRLLAPPHLPQEQSQRPGRIPGAINVPWSWTANDDGTFKTDDEITAIYESAGIDFSKPTIAYCRIGERSSHSWFAIHELLGHTDIKNYDGSWTEYGSLVGVPIELG